MAEEHRLNLRFTDDEVWRCLCSYAAGNSVSMNEACLQLIRQGLAFQKDGIMTSVFFSSLSSLINQKLSLMQEVLCGEFDIVVEGLSELADVNRASSLAILAAAVDAQPGSGRSRDERLELYRQTLPYLMDGLPLSEAEAMADDAADYGIRRRFA